MYAMIAAAALQAASIAFAPPLDRPIAYTMTETREDARATQRFVVERVVTFSRRTAGYLAVVETRRVDGGAAGGAGKLFQSATADMIGRRVRVLLDTEGRVVDVEDRDAEWARQLGALDRALAGGSAARQATVAGLLAPLRALDGQAKAARIAEIVDAVLPLPTWRRGASPARTVTMDGNGPAGTVTLTGTEEIVSQPDGALRFRRRMAGEALDVVETRHIRGDGLVREAVDVRTLRTADRTMTITRRTTIAP